MKRALIEERADLEAKLRRSAALPLGEAFASTTRRRALVSASRG